MRIIKSTLLVVIGLFTFVSMTWAQGQKRTPKSPMMQRQPSINPDSISEAELEKFAGAMQQAQRIRMQASANVKKMVEEEGMSFKRFRMIQMSKRNKKMKDTMTVTDAEKATMDSLQPKIQKASKTARQGMMKAIKSEGLSVKRFQNIGRAMRQSKELQQRLQKIQKEMRKNSPSMKQKLKQQMKKKMQQQQDTSGSN